MTTTVKVVYNRSIYIYIMDYRPYSREWTRKRYLAEAIEEYFNTDASTDVIIGDISDVLQEKANLYQRRATKFKQVLKGVKEL